MAAIVPSKGRSLGPDARPAPAPRTLVAKDPTLAGMDGDDQFDIPTFLRRQGHTEMP
jgi:cell division protein FtsZ